MLQRNVIHHKFLSPQNLICDSRHTALRMSGRAHVWIFEEITPACGELHYLISVPGNPMDRELVPAAEVSPESVTAWVEVAEQSPQYARILWETVDWSDQRRDVL